MLLKMILLISMFSLSAVAAFDWQGHRGARGLYPENTINAMKEAAKFPITTLELDVVISKDNDVVVSHEPWMSEEMCLTSKGEILKDREERNERHGVKASKESRGKKRIEVKKWT